MMLALTIFGLLPQGEPAVFCCAFLRAVRGAGDYPPPTLPSGLTTMRTNQTTLTGFDGVEVLAWDCMVEGAQRQAVLDAFAEGQFTVPPECPVEPGRKLCGCPV